MIAVFTNSNRTSSLLSGLFTYFLLPLLFLNCVTPLNSQSLNLFDVDASAYPIIKAKFFAFDAQGVQQRPLSTDLVLKENNISRNITSVICPSNPPTKALSSVLVIDISGSMFGGRGNAFNIDLAKSAAKAWVNGLPQGKSECAVTSFNDFNYMNQDFTNDKQKLITAINKLWPGGGTNYDAALINPMAGGLQVSARGKHERVIVMLTDGFAYPPDMNAVLNEAKKQSCIIYCVTLGMPAPQSLIDIALQTGGKYFENVTTITEAEQIYRSILQTSQGTEPCSITWETSCQPDSISNIDLSWQNVSSKGSYKQPQNAKGALTFSPLSYRFKDPVIGSDITQKVTITASNSKITVSNIVPSNSAYNLTPSSFTLQANESKELTLKYRAVDSGLTFCKFSFVSDGCEQEYYATGGYTGKKPSKPTLKLTHPNGGEQFVVGSDTVITWQGIAPSDTVQLDFSTNNGVTWKKLAENVANLKYIWKNIPPPTSTNCRVRVRQEVVTKVSGSTKVSPPDIVDQQTSGGTLGDFSHSVIEASDGSMIIAGYTESSNLDIVNKRGGNGNIDFWIIKLDNNGSLVWQKTFGGTDFDRARSITETIDGSFIVFGETVSNDLDVTNKKGGVGNLDYWVLKLNNSGSIIWQKTFGGSKDDWATQVIESRDGSLMLLGETVSSNTDISNKRGGGGNKDIWIVKLSKDGNLLWQKTFGGTKEDNAASIHETLDGSFVVAATTYSDDLDITDKRSVFVNNADFWIFKIDGNGKLLWQEVYGGSNDEITSSLIENSDGNIFVTGTTNSNNLDISNKRGGQGNQDIWVLKLNSDGNLLWQKTFGGTKNDESSSIREISDGSITIAGNTYSSDLDISSKRGAINESDAWIVKIDTDGNIVWEKTSGGTDYDIAKSQYERKDGQLVIVGNTKSKDFDAIGKKSGGNDSDFWYYILNSDSSPLQLDISDTTFSIVEPIAKSKDIDMGNIIVGSIRDSVVPDFVSNIGSYPFQVKNILFTGNDASAFSLVSGSPVYKVDANKASFGEFRFSPKRTGVHQAQIQIITQSDTLIQNIRGVGVSKSIMVKNTIIDFGTVDLGQSKDTIQSATITNTGTVPIQITNIRHGLPNDIDFTTLQGGTPFTLQPGSTHTMNLRFSPKDIGLTSGVLEFSYNGIGSPAIVQLFGRGRVGPKITSSSSGAVLTCGNDTTISIVVQNPGDDTLLLSNAKITGLHSNEFSLINSFPKAVTNNDSLTLSINVRRNGTGLRNAEVILQTNVNGIDSIFTIPIQVQVESIDLAFEKDTLDIGFLSPGSSNDTFIVIKNNGTIATGFKSTSTSNINQLQDSIIQQGNVYRLPMRVSIPSQETSISENIIITDDICGRSDTLYVIGRSRISDTVRTTVSLPNISAKPGDTISITMAITNSNKLNLPNAPVNYTATIGINPSIVHVTDNSLTFTKVDNSNYHYTFTGIRNNDSILLTIPAIATLGPTDRTPLEIVSFKWIDTLIANEVETIDGSVTITDLCEDGGVRLFIPGGSSFSLTSRPNPAASTVELLFGLAEPTPVSIKIIDYTGQIVATPVTEPSMGAGFYTRTIDVSTLPAGPYVIMLTSPNASLHSRMDILR
jgi:hypothetical protein